MAVLTFLLWLLIAAYAAATLLPFLKIHHGSIRGLAFPRLQWFWIGLILIVLNFLILDGRALVWASGGVLALALVHAGYITKFTAVWPVQSADATTDERSDTGNHIKILAANIKMSNRDYAATLAYIRETSPDVAVIVEPDDDWVAALEPLHADYPHIISAPQDNGYGLCVLSRLELPEHDIRCLVTEDVISIRTSVVLRSGAHIRLYVVHPEPPIASHDTKGRDSEIALSGIEARDDDLPAIVTGDLNDVAWSTTTRSFQRISGLLDPRVGRGFFNTFHAGYPIFRWPLDHLFHSARFRFIGMERGPNVGSDHFPVVFELALTPEPKGREQVQDEVPGEEEETREMIEAEAKRSRSAIGTDWEDED